MKFLILTFLLPLSFSYALAASVEKVGATGPVVLMESKDEFALDEAVCFYEKDKKVACGKVSKIKKLKALIKVKKSALDKIAADMIVKPKDQKKSTASQDQDTAKGEKNRNEKSGLGESQDPAPKKGGIMPFLAAAFAPITNFKSNNLDYQPPIEGKTEPLWKSENPISTGAYMLMGARYKKYQAGIGYALQNMIAPNNVDLDYDAKNDKKYTSLTLSRSFFSIFGDYLIDVFPGEITTTVGAGIGIINNNLKFSADQLEDQVSTSTRILSGSSSLMVVSARFPVISTISLGPFSLLLGGTVSIGLIGTAKTSGKITDANSPDGTSEFSKFKSALDHKKNTFGIDLFGGLLAEF